MGIQPGAELDAWLREGGLVVASSDRAARAIQAHFHRQRRAEGFSAWAAPDVVDWKTFARNAWEARNLDGRLVLNSAQELALWSEIIHSEKYLPTALPSSVRRLASMAMDAHDLLCSYAPQFLRASTRIAWDQDAGKFSEWLADFDEHCGKNGLISISRLPLELISVLQEDSSARPPLRISGFDRVLPTQRRFFDAWGSWQQFQPEHPSTHIGFHSAGDSQTELESCAFWCQRQLATKPGQRLLVVMQDLSQHRGEVERAFLRFRQPGSSPQFEFSLGVSLRQVPLVRSALLLLRWLNHVLEESALDWLFASGIGASLEESAALQASMRRLRDYGLQRVQWELESFLNQATISDFLPPQWKRRMITAQRSLKEVTSFQNPIAWADKVPQLLETIGWPGARSQESVDFQALRRWQQALDTVGSLGFDGRRISWHDFLTELEHTADDILFSPQSTDAQIQIAGPAESAGLTADALWFLSADEESWPGSASRHPFLPPYVQREAAMPHSSHQLDWQFASTITQRLLASATEVHFSFALQKDDVESRPSRLIAQLAVAPLPMGADLLAPPNEPSAAIPFADSSSTPFAAAHLRGGAAVLSSQSQCPFKAFATARLAADGWDAAEAGLSAKQRGQILHEVLHSIWSGRRPGIRSRDDLIAISNLAGFVSKHVKAVLKSGLPPGVSEQMPQMYLELEETRLVRLVSEWLEFEKTRMPFTVEQTEAESTVTIAGLNMNLRLDRVDRLCDGSSLVIDYKTGTVDPKSWDLPRPDDLQLPLYKVFGLEPVQPSLFDSYGGPASGGLVFARVRTGDVCFAGRVVDAQKTLVPGLGGNSSLVKRKLTGSDESEWKEYIEQLAEEFIHGRADVDPREYPKTCERCGLQSVCVSRSRKTAHELKKKTRRVTMQPKNSSVVSGPPDQAQRTAALDPHRSILVQAPAGSGKTDLLTRRFLRLLAEVDDPSQIVAITFTKAAAAEMRHRILAEVEKASARNATELAADEFSMEALAERALERSRLLDWRLLELASQLRISTIDSFCRDLAIQQPIYSGIGNNLQISERPTELYRRAARAALEMLGDPAHPILSDAIKDLLLWRDNNWKELEELLATMLGQRDRWMHKFVLDRAPDWNAIRNWLERPFVNTVRAALDRLTPLFEPGC